MIKYCKHANVCASPTAKICLYTGLLFVSILFCNGCKKDFQPIERINQDEEGLPTSGKGNLISSKPNIILIIADDVGYEIPGYTGGQSYTTPNLDYMASRGIQFTQAYCHPDGFPSRLAMITGKYNFRNYMSWGILPPTEKTIANMLHDAGYATCFVGKWQNGGGDESIHNAGFDQYLAYLPFTQQTENELIHRYKDPILYKNGAYLPDSETHGKYSEDLNVKYLNNFIDSNVNNPFFAIYSMPLVQRPWSPTPDDPEFISWDPETSPEDKNFFPSMVAYMDKKIGEILLNLQENGLKGKTLVIFTTDNATNTKIKSIYRGVPRKGKKNKTSLWGIRIPFLAFWPAKIPVGQVSNTLIDFTDFLPTLAKVAKIQTPMEYGILDGVSFFDDMRNIPGTDRSWSYCYWDNDPNDNKPAVKYVLDTMYKLYDTPLYDSFYNVKIDVDEISKLNMDSLSINEQAIRNTFIQVLQSMHN